MHFLAILKICSKAIVEGYITGDNQYDVKIFVATHKTFSFFSLHNYMQ